VVSNIFKSKKKMPHNRVDYVKIVIDKDILETTPLGETRTTHAPSCPSLQAKS
jgi:hypothetical protein